MQIPRWSLPLNSSERQSRWMMLTLFGLTAAMLVLVWVLAWIERPRLPDFGQYKSAEARKSAFFNYLLPVVQEENDRIATLRAMVERLREKSSSGKDLDAEERRLLEVLAGRYRSPVGEPAEPGFFDELLKRIDQVPASLVLAQAAMESGWGRSRFARQGFNLFGHWCDEPGCGFVPAKRPDGARYEVASFDTVRESVRKYLLNLNSHRAYEHFRAARAAFRRQHRPLSGVALARALESYSERGAAYVRDIRAMILANGLVECTRDPETPC